MIQQLRRAREAKGMELKEIEEITKIRTKYLKALEEGDYCVLPGGAYTVGFLRSYARVLDLDAESLVNTFRLEVNKTQLETSFDNTTKEIHNRLTDQTLLVKILQLYREVGLIFKFNKTNRVGESKR